MQKQDVIPEDMAPATSQTVYRLTAQTSYHDIKPHTEPIPEFATNEVRIAVKSVSLNYRDLVMAKGTYPFPIKSNIVPCSDAAGVVAQVGSSVTDFAVGDKVLVNFDLNVFYGVRTNWDLNLGSSIDGVLREYITVPDYSVTKIPEWSKLKFEEIASLVCTGVTAWNALYGAAPLKPGQTVLFQGTGGVSMTGLVLAKAAGAVTIITSSSDEKLKVAKEKYGADYVVNYKTHPDWETEVLKLTNGQGADIILENGGSGTIKKSLECVAMGGAIAVIGFLSNAAKEDMPDVIVPLLGKMATMRGISVGNRQMMEDLVQFVVSKDLHMPIDKIFKFSDEGVLKAYECLEKGGMVGKICINL